MKLESFDYVIVSHVIYLLLVRFSFSGVKLKELCRTRRVGEVSLNGHSI